MNENEEIVNRKEASRNSEKNDEDRYLKCSIRGANNQLPYIFHKFIHL